MNQTTQDRKRQINKLIQRKREQERRTKKASSFIPWKPLEQPRTGDDYDDEEDQDYVDVPEEPTWVDVEEGVEEKYYDQEELRKMDLDRRAQEKREQDEAYETSALIDKSKEEEKKRIEKERQRKIEQQQSTEAQKQMEESKAKLLKEQQLKDLESKLPPEPPLTSNVVDTNNPIYHITIQLPNSQRISRSFHHTNTLQQLKDFIDTRALYGIDIPAHYRIISNYPTQVWDDLNQIISDTTFQKRQLLRVEKL